MTKIWWGMSAGAWLRLLARNRLDLEPRCWPEAAGITLFSVVNTMGGLLQRLAPAGGRRAAGPGADPVFVIGHWRSGTTLLHHLLGCDAGFSWPDGFQCALPHLHLLLGNAGRRAVRRLTPASRPMDPVALDPGDPQEDELALCNLGLPSPYARLAFPNRPLPWPEGLTLDGLSPRQRRRWRRTLVRFLGQVTAVRPGRPLLKSPAHTCRLPHLLAWFPDARFVYLVRSPYETIPSTLHARRVLAEQFGFQRPDPALLRASTFEGYERLIERYHATRDRVPEGQLHEVRFEDLVSHPPEALAGIYRALDLGDPAALQPRLHARLDRTRDHPRRPWPLDPGLREEIAQRCAPVIEEYGYR